VIDVAHWFRQDLSTDINASFIHNYQINIVNKTKYSVQLLTREWHVKHLLHGVSEVSGKGVVGQQPVLLPGESFEYTSGCELISSIGSMKGTFYFVNIETDELFQADISEFNLVYPPLLN
jgi:ApaG protein